MPNCRGGAEALYGVQLSKRFVHQVTTCGVHCIYQRFPGDPSSALFPRFAVADLQNNHRENVFRTFRHAAIRSIAPQKLQTVLMKSNHGEMLETFEIPLYKLERLRIA